MHDIPRRDIGSMFGCVAFIAVGIAAFMAAGDYSSLGSVFPRTISALMVFFACLYLVLAWLKPSGARINEAGSRGRQVGVVLVMLGWAFILVPVGFLTSSVIAFVLLLVIANYDSWTPRRALLYAIATAFVLGILYTLFKTVLQVPLPEGIFL